MSLQLTKQDWLKTADAFGVSQRSELIAILGCDPGPEYSALAMVVARKDTLKPCCSGAAFISNEDLNACNSKWDVITQFFPYGCRSLVDFPMVFSYERVANQGRIVGKQVFDTCAMSGSLCRHARHDLKVDAIASFTPSGWRYIVTGLGNAKDSETRRVLEDFDIEYMKEHLNNASRFAKTRYNYAKSCMPHLRDAIGAALANFLTWQRMGDEMTQHVLWVKSKETK